MNNRGSSEERLNPVVAAEIRSALREATASLRREHTDRDAVVPKMNRLIAAGLPVKELATPAGRIRDLIRTEFE